jgi:transposase-like protein
MKVECPRCGKEVTVNGLGRRRLNLGVKIILDTVKSTRSISETAKLLNCSRGHIYGVLKQSGMKAKEVINK